MTPAATEIAMRSRVATMGLTARLRCGIFKVYPVLPAITLNGNRPPSEVTTLT